MSQIIECVPNFSEGRDLRIIRQITEAIETVDGVTLLNVEPGKATNRTVVTFAGPPSAVVEAALLAAAKSAELIDMRRHTGEHPRFGAMDVCPLVPISGITMEETVAHARQLGRWLGEELGLTIYLYEHAATHADRRNLAVIRAGEYEGLERRLALPQWQPDFGPATFNARSGATAVGAREFLVALNVNLNTTSTRRANAVAFDVREKGRIRRLGDPLSGEIVRDPRGDPVWDPGTLTHVKAIGWMIEEYGIAQVSMNLTNIRETPIHIAFDEVCRAAEARGLRVTGAELVGLAPLQAMLDAGEHYLRKQQRSLGVPDEEIVKIAVRSLGLDELAPFDPHQKVIEWVLAGDTQRGLADRTLTEFVRETASESPAPGGGSIAAAVGAMGAALGAMVANLSAHRRGWDDRWEEFSSWAIKGKRLQERLLRLVDEDTAAFNALMTAYRLPKSNPAEEEARRAAVQQATRLAIDTPLEVMEAAVESMELLRSMAEQGMKASASDAGVGALCARTAALGAYLNVQTNAPGLADVAVRAELLGRATDLRERAQTREAEILEIAASRI